MLSGTLPAVLCFACIVEWQLGEMLIYEQIRPAVTIYEGEACCMEHLNKRRGSPADPTWRYPEPVVDG